jgi:hypothetical protein
MPSLLSCANQAFWVTNATKDLLYDASIEVAKRESPVAYQRLVEDGRLIGCYGVSGIGFELEAFAQAFGGKDKWREAFSHHWDAVEALCPTPGCLRLVRKLFAWIWFLLDGGACSIAADSYPNLEQLGETPGELPPSLGQVSLGDREAKQSAGERTIRGSTKMALGIGLGALLGASVGVTNIVLGLAQNWLTVPAWILAGALLGSAHPTVEMVLDSICRPDRLPEQPKQPGSRS